METKRLNLNQSRRTSKAKGVYPPANHIHKEYASGITDLEDKVNQDVKDTATPIFSGVILGTNAPLTSTDSGVAGTITWDSTHIFVCVATDTWKRVGISTW
jgi:hypothetical protein